MAAKDLSVLFPVSKIRWVKWHFTCDSAARKTLSQRGGNGKPRIHGSILAKTEQEFDEPLEVGLYVGICDGKGKQIAQFEYFEDLLVPFDVSPRAKLPIAWGDLKRRHNH